MASVDTPTPSEPVTGAVADGEVPLEVAASAPVLATTLGGYLRAWWKRMRSGESGVLPVVGGLIVLSIIFQTQSSYFLTAGNITALMVQGLAFVVLGMAEVWLLVLGEIDLSVGYVSAIGAAITAILISPPHPWPLWVAMPVGIVVTGAIGALWGLIVIRLHVASFIVTLAGLLGSEGVLIWLVNSFGTGGGGTIRIENNVFLDLTSGNLSPVAGWVVTIAAVVVFGGVIFLRDRSRRRSGLVAPPQVVTVAKIAGLAAAGVALVLVCNTNRGELVTLRGIPYGVVIVIALVALTSFMLGRTRFGRYLYAIGANEEAARRAGVSLAWNRLWAFVLTGATAGVGGMLYASRLGSVSNNVDGGTLVLYAVAAAVIGGASLFGGRGKMAHALLGGIVIATIYNGMGLIGLAADYQYMVTGLVLLAAVTVDALARRGRTTS